MSSMMSLFVSLLFLTCYIEGLDQAVAREKKILLHGDQDILNVIATLQAKVTSLESKVSKLETTKQAASTSTGSTYVRWGRTSCPGNGTEIVFDGRMAGSKWDQHFGGSNSICLPNDPTWGQYIDGIGSDSAIYGTEIENSDKEANVLFGKPIRNEDIPCSVCRTRRPTSVMISGRANCYPGWTLEYQGYLVSSGTSYSNNVDYVCLDAGLEFAPHGASNDDEHIVTVVEVHCGGGGSLPCPPYVQGRELACVVCSK